MATLAEIANMKAMYVFCCNYAKTKVLEMLFSTVQEIIYDLLHCSHRKMIMTKRDTVKSKCDSHSNLLKQFWSSMLSTAILVNISFASLQLKIKKLCDIVFCICRKSLLYEKLSSQDNIVCRLSLLHTNYMQIWPAKPYLSTLSFLAKL